MTPTTRETADHAELARLAEVAMSGPLSGTIGAETAYRAAANPATVLALLSEIAALRGEVNRLHAEADENGLLAYRLTQAERQRDELRKALEWYGEQARLARLIHQEGDAGRHALADDGGKRARTLLANQGAEQ